MQRRDKSPQPNSTNQRVRKPTQAMRDQIAYWLARDHSCDSLTACDSFIKKLMEILGDRITTLELDKQRIPCAAFQAMTVAGQLANIDQAKHDLLDQLESNPASIDLEEDGAVEPISYAKDSHMQHSKMIKFRAPTVPRLDLGSQKKRSKKLRSGSIMVLGPRKSSQASLASDSNAYGTSGRSPNSKPESSQRRTTLVKGQLTVELSDIMNVNFMSKLSGRKTSSGTAAGGHKSEQRDVYGRQTATALSSSQRGAHPINLDMSLFEKKFEFADDLQEKDFDHLRKVVAKRKEQRRKIKEAQDLENARIAKEKKSVQSKKFSISINQNKPVKFTFDSQGQVIFKKTLNVDNLPAHTYDGLEIKSVSKITNLSAIQRKKEAQEAAAAEIALKLKEAQEKSTMSNDQQQSTEIHQISAKLDQGTVSQVAKSRHVSSIALQSAGSQHSTFQKSRGKNTLSPTSNSIINTARSDFPSNLDSKHLHSNLAKDKKTENSFIAQSKFVPAPGVRVTLENGTVLSHKAQSTNQEGEGSLLTLKDIDSQQASMVSRTDEIHTAEVTVDEHNPSVSPFRGYPRGENVAVTFNNLKGLRSVSPQADRLMARTVGGAPSEISHATYEPDILRASGQSGLEMQQYQTKVQDVYYNKNKRESPSPVGFFKKVAVSPMVFNTSLPNTANNEQRSDSAMSPKSGKTGRSSQRRTGRSTSNPFNHSHLQSRLDEQRKQRLFKKNLLQGSIQVATPSATIEASQIPVTERNIELYDLLVDKSGHDIPEGTDLHSVYDVKTHFNSKLTMSPTFTAKPTSFHSNTIMVQNESAEFIPAMPVTSKQANKSSKIESKWGKTSEQQTQATNRTLLLSQRGWQKTRKDEKMDTNVLSAGAISPATQNGTMLLNKSMFSGRQMSSDIGVHHVRTISTKNQRVHVFSHQDRVEHDTEALQAKLEQVQTVIRERARSSKPGSKPQPALLPPRQTTNVLLRQTLNDQSFNKLPRNVFEKMTSGTTRKGDISQAPISPKGVVSVANLFERRAIQSSHVSTRQRAALLGQLKQQRGNNNMSSLEGVTQFQH